MKGLRVASSMGSSQRFSPSMPRMPQDSTSAASSLLATWAGCPPRPAASASLRQVGREASSGATRLASTAEACLPAAPGDLVLLRWSGTGYDLFLDGPACCRSMRSGVQVDFFISAGMRSG